MKELNQLHRDRLNTIIRELMAKRRKQGQLSKSESNFLNTALALAS